MDKILEKLPTGKRLIEPFFGSGAVFLNTDYESYLLNDINIDLISMFTTLLAHPEEVKSFLSGYFSPEYNQKGHYNKVRSRFNEIEDIPLYDRAAMFIYMNRHCFNGLMRYNRFGKFNVPFGSYPGPKLPLEEINAFLEKAKKVNPIFTTADFEPVIRSAEPGDVIYCDPPYVPLSDTAKFTGYAPYNFTLDHQRHLAAAVREVSREKGIPILLSNHDVKLVRDLYADADEIISFPVRRMISCKADTRGMVNEVLILYKGKN
jgi:DNA adenine methylase